MVRVTNAVEQVLEEKAREILEKHREEMRRKYRTEIKQLAGRWQLYKETKDKLENAGFRTDEEKAYPCSFNSWNFTSSRERSMVHHAIAVLNQLPSSASLEQAYEIAESVMDNLVRGEVKKG